jgi:preprotein translocase subunit SecB
MSFNDGFKKHPIQLNHIKVIQLSLKINTANNQDKMPEEGSFELYHGHSPFNTESREIAVKLGVVIDSETEKNSPFDLTVEILGIFSVSEDFEEKYVESWAKGNAPLIIYPYLREHAYSLTSRAGFEGLILPLFEIPVFKVNK